MVSSRGITLPVEKQHPGDVSGFQQELEAMKPPRSAAPIRLTEALTRARASIRGERILRKEPGKILAKNEDG